MNAFDKIDRIHATLHEEALREQRVDDWIMLLTVMFLAIAVLAVGAWVLG